VAAALGILGNKIAHGRGVDIPGQLLANSRGLWGLRSPITYGQGAEGVRSAAINRLMGGAPPVAPSVPLAVNALGPVKAAIMGARPYVMPPLNVPLAQGYNQIQQQGHYGPGR
jgi:hypothetical protein